jgi:hypothetical protein
MKKTSAIFWGIILILVGVFLVLGQLNIIENFNIFKIQYLWPSFLILLGILFHVQFFSGKGKSAGILVPGGILIVYGCLFLYMGISGWSSVGSLWPIFLVGPGFGLLELKLFSKGKEGSWVPVIILLGLAMVFFIGYSLSSFWMAAAVGLIIIGIAIIIASIIEGSAKKHKKVEVHVDMDDDN